MIYETIKLKDYYKKLDSEATLTLYCPDNSPEIDSNRKRQTILIIPGGGYQAVSFREGEPIALRFLGYDFNVCVLKYSCAPKTDFPYPLIEAIAAVDYLNKHADAYNVDINKISAMGFSAGGHLAASLAAHGKKQIFKEFLGVEELNANLFALILCYSVISSDPLFSHAGSINNICKKDPEILKEFFSIEKQVTNDFPRTFLFAFEGDDVVPVRNSYAMIEALKNKNIECEYHFYQGHVHGSALGDRSVYHNNFDVAPLKETTEWPTLAINFLRKE